MPIAELCYRHHGNHEFALQTLRGPPLCAVTIKMMLMVSVLDKRACPRDSLSLSLSRTFAEPDKLRQLNLETCLNWK